MGPWCYGILLDQPTRSPAAFAVTSLEGCSPLQPRSPWGDLNFAWALLWPHGAKGLAPSRESTGNGFWLQQRFGHHACLLLYGSAEALPYPSVASNGTKVQ
jgi:hypothetical protein